VRLNILSRSFEKLDVWKRAASLAVMLFELLENDKHFGLKDQILRSAVSIVSNIAEGSERDSIADFNRFLSYAKGSAAELRTQIYIACKAEIIDEIKAKEIIEEVKSISKMIQSLQNSLKVKK